ncbi:redoxin domain-containing protein [Rubrobacter indicoceani]|uniref:redoxin domain-containing protein n=1 Tax=Rubrobacter indicoceani TaxID=2051957 RepID=UPI000E5AF398|nr:redoxin domain-containing protein [Rubrobacter indicoceani]
MTVEIGKKAPEFTLPADSWEREVSLQDELRDGPLVLFFYPGDWSSVCTDQLEVIEDYLPQFGERGARVAAISVDSPWSHAAFAHARELTITLLSDFNREVTKSYGVLRDEGFPDRAYFVIGKDGTVLARRVEDSPSKSPDPEDVISDLDRVVLS